MISRTHCCLTGFLLLHFIAVGGHVFAETGAKTAKAPIHPALVQVDEDPKLPRVLLIGDSITMGYTAPLRELLAGKANVQHPPENCGPSRRILEHLDRYLGKKRWDVIQLNCGIHDLTYLNEARKVTAPKDGGKPQVPLDEYRANLEMIVARLKKTGATLIWCTTTPMNHPDVYRLPADVDRYNEVAKGVMEKNGVQINDLNRRVHDFKKPMWTPEGVHYTPEGYRELAGAAAPVIEAALPAARK
jgi:acyl-CoA thioesterase-1